MSPAPDSIMANRKPAAKVGQSRVSKPKPAAKVAPQEAHSVPERIVRQAKDDDPPPITEVKPVTMGEVEYKFSVRKFVQQRMTFEGERVSRSSVSQDYVQMRHNEIEDGSYHSFERDSIRVETEDRFGLVMVVKRGMWAGKSGMEAELREQLKTAFRDFVKAYPPEQPQDKNVRHLVAQETGKIEWISQGLPWGRLHLASWHMVGHPNESIRLSAHAADPKHAETVRDFMQKTAWEHDQISTLRDDGQLGHLDQGPTGIHAALVPIVNMTVQPHKIKDPDDARLSWTSTNTWCYYEGAWEPGNIVFCRSAYLEHWVTKITKGQWYCNTRFSKGNVQNPLDLWVKCPVPGCVNNPTGRVDSLYYHVKKQHSALTDEEVEAIITGLEDETSVFSAADVRKFAHWLRKRGVPRIPRKSKGEAKKRRNM
ncbi:hypothetical protein IMSHALPRED_002526 [Imshaugia aleurites]|uniref:Uncharacterized protein n=1 Tax=Imshaugia aleurites TaxID=172621 RepID=A0A8H3J624_9LECA|nr:hypothetical protein IMSHALPRED_002526 [Imshaugia aleurites]